MSSHKGDEPAEKEFKGILAAINEGDPKEVVLNGAVTKDDLINALKKWFPDEGTNT